MSTGLSFVIRLHNNVKSKKQKKQQQFQRKPKVNNIFSHLHVTENSF